MLLIGSILTLAYLVQISPLREWPWRWIDPLITRMALEELSQADEVE